jgi:hypothetical protein
MGGLCGHFLEILGTVPLSSSNGMPLPVGDTLTFAMYPGQASVSLSVVCASASTATVGYLFSGAH